MKKNENKEGSLKDGNKRKCQCCKGYGHRENSCTKDPNIRSDRHVNVEEEDDRIHEQQQDIKKYNKETNELTINMLSQLVQQSTNSKRLMSFDDFQYNQINTIIFNQNLTLPVSNENSINQFEPVFNEVSSKDDDEKPPSE